MAIKTNYNFNGVEVKDAYVRVDRIWGSSKDGWTALVGVYNIVTEEVPAMGVEGEEGYVPASTQEVKKLITEFNENCSYNEDERGYVSMYNALTGKFGGVEV